MPTESPHTFESLQYFTKFVGSARILQSLREVQQSPHGLRCRLRNLCRVLEETAADFVCTESAWTLGDFCRLCGLRKQFDQRCQRSSALSSLTTLSLSAVIHGHQH